MGNGKVYSHFRWSKSQKITKDGVLNDTMALYYSELKEGCNVKKILELVCSSVEIQEQVPWRGQEDMDAVTELFKQVRAEYLEKTGEKLEYPKKVYVFLIFREMEHMG